MKSQFQVLREETHECDNMMKEASYVLLVQVSASLQVSNLGLERDREVNPKTLQEWMKIAQTSMLLVKTSSLCLSALSSSFPLFLLLF